MVKILLGFLYTVHINRYTYGKPVKGQAVVTVGPKVYGGYQPLVSDLLSRRTISVDGKGYVEFDIKNDLKATDDYQRDFDIEATVTEDLTGLVNESMENFISTKFSHLRKHTKRQSICNYSQVQIHNLSGKSSQFIQAWATIKIGRKFSGRIPYDCHISHLTISYSD